jgi:hypothetical protein
MSLWSEYKTIEFHTIEGRYKLFLSGSHLRIQDMDESLKCDRIVWNEYYRIDMTRFLEGYLIDFNARFARILSERKTLKQAKEYIESKFLLV